MSGEKDLARLLATMAAERLPGSYVFATVPGPLADVDADADVLASVRESEGLSVVVAREDADRLGLPYDFVAGWITLRVHSALDAVGLTAAVSVALTEAGISCNVVAGHHHDHVLVPLERTDEALEVLRRVSARD